MLILASAVTLTLAGPVRGATVLGSGDCWVVGTKLYRYGVFLRDLTPAEQSEAENYKQAVGGWVGGVVDHAIEWTQQTVDNWINSLRGNNGNNNFTPASMQSQGDFPAPPYFCNTSS